MARPVYTVDQFGPSDLLTSARAGIRRVQVDVGNTGFFDGRAFRLSYEFSSEKGNQIASGAARWLRLTATTPFILQLQRLSVDGGGIRFRVFRGGVASGTWSPISTSRLNVVNDSYTSQVAIDDGGSVDTTGIEETEVIRVLVAGATAQATTITSSASDERFLPAGTYYLQLENIAGSGAAEGVFDLQWEERPPELE